MAINIYQAKTQFSRLVARVEAGEEITIARAGKPVARLVPIEPAPGRRAPGGLAGLVELSDDWDDAETNRAIADLFEKGPLFPEEA